MKIAAHCGKGALSLGLNFNLPPNCSNMALGIKKRLKTNGQVSLVYEARLEAKAENLIFI
jgi:hypothetical protein